MMLKFQAKKDIDEKCKNENTNARKEAETEHNEQKSEGISKHKWNSNGID